MSALSTLRSRTLALLLAALCALLASAGSAQVEAWRAQFGSEPSKPFTGFSSYPFFGPVQVAAASPDGSFFSLVQIDDGSPPRLLLSRHDATGTLSWTRNFEGWSFADLIATDELGNAYLYHSDGGTAECAAVHKIDASGSSIWKSAIDDFPDCGHGVRRLVASGDAVYGAGTFGSSEQLFVTRFASDGSNEWTYTRDNGPTDSAYVSTATADPDGALLVAASRVRSISDTDTDSDYLLVKVSPAGDALWERTFDSGTFELITAIIAAPDGRVTITGFSRREFWVEEYQSFDSVLDYVTLQYDSSGNELWRARVERDTWGSLGIFPLSPAIAVDSGGNVWLTGAVGRDEAVELLVVKYGPTGAELFRKLLPQRAEGIQVVVDASDRAYVTAPLLVEQTEIYRYEETVLAFAPDGTLSWQETTESAAGWSTSPVHLLVHDSGLVTVGSRVTYDLGNEDADVFWRGLSFGGAVLWESGEPVQGTADWYCGPYEYQQFPNRAGSCVAHGPAGAVYLGGSSSFGYNSTYDQRAVKLDAAGELEWTRGFFATSDAGTVYNKGATALAAGADGRAHLAGAFSTEIFVPNPGGGTTNQFLSTAAVLAFDTDGNGPSVENLEGGGEVAAVGVDSEEATYVLGYVEGGYPSYESDVRLDKLQPTGGVAWSRTHTGPAKKIDRPRALLVTPDDRIVFVGQQPVETHLDALARAYDKDGNVLFSTTFDSIGAEARLVALAASPTGAQIVAAGTAKNATDLDALVVRVDSAGSVVWRRDIDGTADEGDDEASAVAIDAGGNTFVAGKTWNGDDFDVFVVKFDPSGNELWRRAIDFGHGDDEAWAAAFDGPGPGNTAGSFWIAGRASNGNDTDALTLRLDADGNELFRSLVAGTEHRNDEHYDLVIGPPGHATVAGVSAEIDESYNFQAIRYVTSPLDVDYDGETSALGDGLLIQRWLFGFRGAVLLDAAVDPALCERCPAATIDVHLSAIVKLLDVDGNGAPDPLTDGILIFRWLFGFKGATLTAGAVDLAHCTRCDAAAIEAYLTTLAD